MFDREGFMEYVGEKSGNSYASGLARIEKIYSVDLDAEYDKDKCDVLLKQIEQDKHTDGLSAKDSKRLSDFASHLKRYIAYRLNSVDTVADRVQFVIKHYKEHFSSVDKNERYKWEALGWYKKHWKIDAEDFAGMLANAFSKTSNLLSSGMYYPYKMITEYAQANPEEVRRIFKVLHDENLPLAERYQVFRDSCKSRIDQIMKEQPGREKALNHYQDLRAVMVYLTFEYPEKYYLFKSTMYSDFRDRIGFREEKGNQASVIGKVGNLSVKFSGYNGNGKADLNVDFSAMIEAIIGEEPAGDSYEEFSKWMNEYLLYDEGIEVSFAPRDGLSNGDTIS